MASLSRVCTGLAVLLLAGHAAAWDSTQLIEPVVVNGQSIPYPVFSIFVTPGSKISVAGASGSLSVTLAGHAVDAGGAQLRASDQPGLEVLEVRNGLSGEICRINVFTLVPAARINKDGLLNGYRIGRYQQEPLHGLDIYRPPTGFVEVTAANLDTRLSPNFKLRQFVTKQAGDFPKYLILRAGLLLNLESILATLNREGHSTSSFVIMSGYRTPYYNHAIGNVPYSRHVYGGAADFYIDENPADGVMDDLNGDGRLDQDDARWLASFIDHMSGRGDFGPRIGGLGVYGPTTAHGPFVHVDVRGTRARW